MKKHALAAGAATIAVGIVSSAQAQYVVGAPIIIPTDNTVITLEFVTFEADYTGELSFLGAGTGLLVNQPVSDTGQPGLGQQAFINQTASTGSPIVLEGTYDAGDVLHFAYRVFEPVDQADTLRTDDPVTATQFAWDEAAGLLHVEDLRPGDPWYDADYDDIVVRVTFSTVPSPAAISMLGLAAMFGRRRRRTAA